MKIFGVLACIALTATVMGYFSSGGSLSKKPVLVCLGDSLTSCGGPNGHYADWLAKYLPNVHVVNAGIGGDTLDGGRLRYERDVSPLKPDIVLIALGANDFWRRQRSVEEMGDDLLWMVKESKRLGAEVIVVDCFGHRDFWNEVTTEFSPDRFPLAAAIGEMQETISKENGCIYVPNLQVDVKPNRLPPYWDETDHPNKEGNEQVALRLLPAIHQALSKR
ncbi:MAG: hypothetical protein IKR48_13850 [Kiritimatiellae bacterium]|nr:hypothetical protein [Kiritimatiellia bacterium]